MAVLGAGAPGIEKLILGNVSGLPTLQLIHPLFVLESGDFYLARLEKAVQGETQPLILVVEGSIFKRNDIDAGFYSGMGEQDGRPQTISDWLDKLVPQATAVIAIGTCATWGGVPAAAGNPTGAMSLGEYLGRDFRSTADLPLINIPGCAPPGENFVETLIYLLLHFTQQVPLELDETNRPAWLYRQQTTLQSANPSLPDYQTEIVIDCRVPEQGWMNHVGGCSNVGGSCNGCTMPGFPDQYLTLNVL
jgi:hydrogenase small subunit